MSCFREERHQGNTCTWVRQRETDGHTVANACGSRGWISVFLNFNILSGYVSTYVISILSLTLKAEIIRDIAGGGDPYPFCKGTPKVMHTVDPRALVGPDIFSLAYTNVTFTGSTQKCWERDSSFKILTVLLLGLREERKKYI